jgi:hypothetical protein
MIQKSNIPTSALFAVLTQAPRPHKELPFPRQNEAGEPVGHYVSWILTQNEQIAAGVAAAESARAALKRASADPKVLDDAPGQLTFSNYLVCEQLWRACRSLEDINVPLFPSPAAMREKLSTAEVTALYDQHLEVIAEMGPQLSEMGSAELDAYCEKIEQGAGNQLPFFSAANANALIRHLADRSIRSPMALGSLGTPLVSQSPESNESTPNGSKLQPKESTSCKGDDLVLAGDESDVSDLVFAPDGGAP